MRILEGLVHMYLRHQREKVWEERRRDKMRDHDAKAARFPAPTVTWAEYRALIAAQKQAYGADGRQGIAPIGEGFIARVTCVSMSPERWLGEILVAGAYHPDIWAGGGQRDPDTIIKVFYQFPPVVCDRVEDVEAEVMKPQQKETTDGLVWQKENSPDWAASIPGRGCCETEMRGAVYGRPRNVLK